MRMAKAYIVVYAGGADCVTFGAAAEGTASALAVKVRH